MKIKMLKYFQGTNQPTLIEGKEYNCADLDDELVDWLVEHRKAVKLEEPKKKEIIEIVTPMFDFSLMSKLTLGKKHWPGLTKQQKGKFTELFTKRLKDSYLDKMLLYTDEKIEYKESVQVGKKVQIPTILTSKDNKISMLYKLYKSKQDWKIYDIEIQGVSLISTYRSQFDEILRSKTVDDLLLKLEKPENK